MKKVLIAVGMIAAVLAAGVYYYITLPAINIHSTGFWWFVISILAAIFVWRLIKANIRNFNTHHQQVYMDKIDASLSVKITGGLLLLAIAVFFIGSLLGSPIINASRYQKLLTVEKGNFAEDVAQADYNTIPLLDRASAALLGDRKMGSMVEFVSQFEAAGDYTQINFQGKPVRVTPLEYASPIKWLTNQSQGIPAYMMIDMTTQETECVMLEEGIKYSKSEYFNRNIYRHLRFHYPTYIFGDQIFFEIDEEGTPFWICPVKKFNIGLFGGETVGRVVMVNAVTGECTDYDVTEVPTWVDKVYSAELLTQLYDYSGVYVNGFLNSVLSQRGCLQTTNGYNYLAMDDDVWVYTGVTSLNADQSNVGFVLMNQRTMETRYYEVEGAIEDSAMSSAQGQVQHLGYKATFPLLLNIVDEPTYFMALKDQAGLVKMYAMVNIQKYQLVATGDTIKECEQNYRALLVENGIIEAEEVVPDKPEAVVPEIQVLTAKGAILELYNLIVDGDSSLYVKLDDGEQSAHYYWINLTEGENVTALNFKVGDMITVTYEATEGVIRKVTGLAK
ncbi:MAG: CvpA family protein [Lachnospiraceae bacterium]|nr:CvpA family protein [Lachnospiraceae bacterium]